MYDLDIGREAWEDGEYKIPKLTSSHGYYHLYNNCISTTKPENFPKTGRTNFTVNHPEKATSKRVGGGDLVKTQTPKDSKHKKEEHHKHGKGRGKDTHTRHPRHGAPELREKSLLYLALKTSRA